MVVIIQHNVIAIIKSHQSKKKKKIKRGLNLLCAFVFFSLFILFYFLFCGETDKRERIVWDFIFKCLVLELKLKTIKGKEIKLQWEKEKRRNNIGHALIVKMVLSVKLNCVFFCGQLPRTMKIIICVIRVYTAEYVLIIRVH